MSCASSARPIALGYLQSANCCSCLACFRTTRSLIPRMWHADWQLPLVVWRLLFSAQFVHWVCRRSFYVSGAFLYGVCCLLGIVCASCFAVFCLTSVVWRRPIVDCRRLLVACHWLTCRPLFVVALVVCLIWLFCACAVFRSVCVVPCCRWSAPALVVSRVSPHASRLSRLIFPLVFLCMYVCLCA